MAPKKVLLLAVAVTLSGLVALVLHAAGRATEPQALASDESPIAELAAASGVTPNPDAERVLTAPEPQRVGTGEARRPQQKVVSTPPIPLAKEGARERNRIDVMVRDSDGHPISMARVIPENPTEWNGAYEWAAAFSGPDGFARISDLPKGPVWVVVSKEAFATAVSEVVELSAVDYEHVLEITLTAGGIVIGKVLDLSGEAAAGVYVSIWLDRLRGDAVEMFEAPSVDQDALTASDGTFRFEHLPAGRHRVHVDPFPHERAAVLEAAVTVEVVDGQTTEVVFEDHTSSSVLVSGLVICNGKPLPNTTVELDPFGFTWRVVKQSTRTDESGLFKMMVPEPGECSFRVELDGHASLSRIFAIPSARTHEIEIVFDTGQISGRVRGPDSVLLAGVSLTAFGRLPGDKGLFSSQFLKSGSDGTFEFWNLPNAVYEISASLDIDTERMRNQLSPTIRGPIHGRPEHPLVGPTTIEGVELGADVNLTLSSAAAIKGIVLGPEGLPVSAGCVRVWLLGGHPIKDKTDWAIDKSGNVLAGGLKPGEYMVRAETRHDVSPWYAVTTRAGQITPVDFLLARGTLIRVTATQRGEPVSGRFVQVGDPRGMPEPFDTLVAGTALLGPIAPGTYRVQIGHGGPDTPLARKTIRITGERSVEVLLELP